MDPTACQLSRSAGTYTPRTLASWFRSARRAGAVARPADGHAARMLRAAPRAAARLVDVGRTASDAGPLSDVGATERHMP